MDPSEVGDDALEPEDIAVGAVRTSRAVLAEKMILPGYS